KEPEASALLLVHPLAAATLEFLRCNGFSHASLPFTPRDSYLLWQRLCKHFPREKIEELDPHTYFVGTPRITLQHTKVILALAAIELCIFVTQFSPSLLIGI